MKDLTPTKNQDLCGAEVFESRSKKHDVLKIVLCIMLALSVIANIVLLLTPTEQPSQQSSQQKIEGKGFDSPQKAVLAYLDAFRKGDVDEMVATFAVESYIENFDLEQYIRKYPTINFSLNIPLPNNNAYCQGINEYGRQYEVSHCIRLGYFELIGIEYIQTHFFSPNGDEGRKEIEAIIDQLNAPDLAKKLSEMEVGNVLTVEDFDCDQQDYEKALSLRTVYLAADEICDVAVELEFDGEAYYFHMQTAKINGKWYNVTTSSVLGIMLGDINGQTGGFAKR